MVVDDAVLAGELPGDFRSAYADVNGTRLHYVAGGRGEPLVLLPGWPVTWWEFRRIMPVLARRYRVIAVDLRGMNLSAKPTTGYDKRTMARDVLELARHLGHGKINIAGHDIGAMVAYSYAVNHPEATAKVALLEVSHPDPSLYEIRLLPGWRAQPVVVRVQPGPRPARAGTGRPDAVRGGRHLRQVPRGPDPGRRARPRDLRPRVRQRRVHPGR
ncbi:hypothetical protein GCM10029964_065720 [Kibdelosporangium lantanae]